MDSEARRIASVVPEQRGHRQMRWKTVSLAKPMLHRAHGPCLICCLCSGAGEV